MPFSDADSFSPQAIRYWLGGKCPACRWSMLESAVEGGSGASGHGSGRGDRYGLVALKADLERAADSLPQHWQSTAVILRKQHRANLNTNRVSGGEDESTDPNQALEAAIWRMSAFLGWAQDAAA